MTRARWHLIVSALAIVGLAAAAYTEREDDLDEWDLFLAALGVTG